MVVAWSDCAGHEHARLCSLPCQHPASHLAHGRSGIGVQLLSVHLQACVVRAYASHRRYHHEATRSATVVDHGSVGSSICDSLATRMHRVLSSTSFLAILRARGCSNDAGAHHVSSCNNVDSDVGATAESSVLKCVEDSKCATRVFQVASMARRE